MNKAIDPQDYYLKIINPYKTNKNMLDHISDVITDNTFIYFTNSKNEIARFCNLGRFIKDSIEDKETINNLINYLYENENELPSEVFVELNRIILNKRNLYKGE